MSKQLITVDYNDFCCKNSIIPLGLHKVSCGNRHGVIVDPGLVSAVSSAIEYKFSNIPVRNEFDGLLAIWDEDGEDDRDRFYMICAYLLRGIIPEIWNLNDGSKAEGS